MKKFMAILLALALTALMPAAFAQAADDFGYVDRFTLEDGTELPVTVEHKTDWEYQTYQDTLVAKDIPVYTVTIPEGTESVQVYLTDDGKSAFGQNAALYSYAYIAETDSLDTSIYAASIEDRGEYYLTTVQKNYDYAWELADWSVGAILVFEVGELPTPDQTKAGDVNGDKSVTVDDAILVLRHIAGLETLSGDSLSAADMNGDQSVDVNDAIAILKSVAGTGSANTGAGAIPTLTIE